MRHRNLLLILLAEIVLFTAIGGGTFHSFGDVVGYFRFYWSDLLSQSAPVLLLAFGMTLVLTTAGIDLSVASSAALIACVMSTFAPGTAFWWTAVPVGLVLGIFLGVGERSAHRQAGYSTDHRHARHDDPLPGALLCGDGRSGTSAVC